MNLHPVVCGHYLQPIHYSYFSYLNSIIRIRDYQKVRISLIHIYKEGRLEAIRRIYALKSCTFLSFQSEYIWIRKSSAKISQTYRCTWLKKHQKQIYIRQPIVQTNKLLDINSCAIRVHSLAAIILGHRGATKWGIQSPVCIMLSKHIN